MGHRGLDTFRVPLGRRGLLPETCPWIARVFDAFSMLLCHGGLDAFSVPLGCTVLNAFSVKHPWVAGVFDLEFTRRS